MFWLENPSILFSNESYVHFVPTEDMTLIEKMNAITRFCIYGIFVGTILKFDDNIIHLLFTIIIGIIIINKLNKNNINSFNNNKTLSSNNINNLSDDLSKLIVKNPSLLQNFKAIMNNNNNHNNNNNNNNNHNINNNNNNNNHNNNNHNNNNNEIIKNETEYSNNNQINEQCTSPTKENPLMNRNLYDNPLKDPACEYDDKTSELVNEKFGYNLYQDIDDMFERYNSQRQFYTTPNTNLPNNQTEFAKWLYQTEPTCKETGVQCVRYEDLRTKRNSD